MKPERKYMERAIELARNGAGFVSPNPQVGAVVVAPDGRIIGEGWHRRYGGPHAEVNAIASVSPSDEVLLPQSTIYVTLEPCSHYGKTPPCSLLLIQKKIKNVVVGAGDPFREVSGRGIKMLREAGINVTEHFMEAECMELNRRFMTAHTLRRPWIQLKWAESADGFIAALNPAAEPAPVALSDSLTLVEMHRERAMTDAILVGVNTLIADNPSLTLRLWPGRHPRPVIFASSRIPAAAKVMEREPILLDPSKPLAENMTVLYEQHGITSLMAEGGKAVLESFIRAGLYDEIRVETSPAILSNGLPSPAMPQDLVLKETRKIRDHLLSLWRRSGDNAK